MNNSGIYDLGDRTITAALTGEVITAGVSAGGAAQAFIDRLEGMAAATVFADFDYGSGGATCVVVVETSIDQGDNWIEVARLDFATADDKKTVCITAAQPALPSSVQALSSEGVVDGVLGDRLRAKVTSTGTYAGGTKVTVRAAVR